MTSGRSPVIADVAKRAGVAPMTVSRVINDSPRVKPETRARVQRAIDELGYRGNMAARTLRGGRSGVIGVAGLESALYGPSQALFEIGTAARRAGRTISFVTVREPSADELRAGLEHLDAAHAEGVIVIAPMTESIEALDAVDAAVPMVITSAAQGIRPSVGIDQVRGARLATDHLLDLGHRTVHHVRGPRGWVESDERADGWRQALLARGARVPRAVNGDWSPRSGYAAASAIAADPEVTAVFVANDQMALGALLAMAEAGRRVPDDVSVVGFDDIPEAEFMQPPLTTVRQDFASVGRRSVELLLEVIDGAAPRRDTVDPELIVRASTGPAPPA